MTLCYDIDISYLYPPAVFDDPEKGALLRRNGMQPHSRTNYVARFRDPRTVQALAGASDLVKAYFQDCGFANAPSGVALPSGTFDDTFRNHQKDVVMRMQENLATHDLSGQHWNGLDIVACEQAVNHAKPVTPLFARVARFLKNAKQGALWVHLMRPTLALPALAFGLVLASQLFSETSETVGSFGLMDPNVTLLMPDGK